MNWRDILEAIVFKLHGGYDPKWYWEGRGLSFMYEPIQRGIYQAHEWLLGRIQDYKPKDMLEVGCGFGRNAKFLNERLDHMPEYTGVDISHTMINKACEYLGTPFPRDIDLRVRDVRDLLFPDNAFELVLSFTTLMHLDHKDVHKAMDECVRVSSKYVIAIEESYAGRAPDAVGDLKINRFTFSRNYVRLFKQHGLRVLGYQELPRRLFAIMGEKR